MIRKSAAIVIKNKSVLYLRKRGLLFYILPGGKIEKGETKKQALEREIQEELCSRIKIIRGLGRIKGKTFNKSIDELENIEMDLYEVKLLDKVKLSREIFDKAYIQYKNIHKFLLTPVGIRTIELLHKKKLIK